MNDARAKPVLEVFQHAAQHMVGDGFHVRNLFPSNDIGEDISPFLLLDYAGPTHYPATDRPRGVGEHPHRGFETVTIVYQGELEHRDSAGNSGRLGPGDVQWMTAASGIVHEEMHAKRFAAKGGTQRMVQLWVNLPKRFKMSPPRYQEIAAASIPTVELAGGAGSARVIAGELQGARGPAKTFSPVNVWDLHLAAGGRVELELPAGQNAALFVLEGRARANGSPFAKDAELVLLGLEGERIRIESEAETKALLLGGAPLGEPVVSHGPFVMNTGEEIRQAIQDYQQGRMGHLA